MTKFSRTSTGKYSVSGKTFDVLIGTRAQVWHGTAYKTTGGLCKPDLMQNKAGRIVSKAKHMSAKKEKRLVKAGFLTKKGHFGFIKNGKSMKKGRSRSRSRSRSRKMRGGDDGPYNEPFDAFSTMKGGMAYGGPLSPHYYDGEGVKTSGVGLQLQTTTH